MLGPITIPAPRDLASVKTAIMDHIAAIDALMNSVSWECKAAEAWAEDAGAYFTDAADCVERAVSLESTYSPEPDDEDEIARRNRAFMASERYP